MGRRRKRVRYSDVSAELSVLTDVEVIERLRAERVAGTSRFVSVSAPLQVALYAFKNAQKCRRCRWCFEWCAKPTQTFCQPACVHEWKLRSDARYLRRHVESRDRGICAECGVDTYALRARLWGEYDHARQHKPLGEPVEAAIARVLAPHRITEHDLWRKTLWEADHVRPVAEGGGLCGLEGIQTLCLLCHRARPRPRAVDSGL